MLTDQGYKPVKIKVFHTSLLYFPLGHGTIYHGKTIIRETETKEKLSFHIEDKERNIAYDAIDILPEYIFIFKKLLT